LDADDLSLTELFISGIFSCNAFLSFSHNSDLCICSWWFV